MGSGFRFTWGDTRRWRRFLLVVVLVVAFGVRWRGGERSGFPGGDQHVYDVASVPVAPWRWCSGAG